MAGATSESCDYCSLYIVTLTMRMSLTRRFLQVHVSTVCENVYSEHINLYLNEYILLFIQWHDANCIMKNICINEFDQCTAFVVFSISMNS